MEDNSTIVTLPFILVRKIVGYLIDAEKIAFTFVCKRFFDNRQSFLYVPLITSSKLSRINFKNLKLHSFAGQVESYSFEDDELFPKKLSTLIVLEDEGFRQFPCVCSYYASEGNFKKMTDVDVPKELDEMYLLFKFNGLFTEIPGIQQVKDVMLAAQEIDCPMPDNLKQLTIFYFAANKFGPRAVLPRCLELLQMNNCNQRFEKGFFPSTLKHLLIGGMYSFRLEPGVLPHGLEFFSLQSHPYREPIAKGVLPSTLKELNLSSYIGNLIFYNASLPIDFASDEGVADESNTYVPSSIKHLALGTPEGLHNTKFAQTLPDSLKSLHLLENFKQKIDFDCFPLSLTKLKMSSFPQQNIVARVPDTIKTLEIGMLLPYTAADQQLPDSIESISISNTYKNDGVKLDWIPSSVKSLSLSTGCLNSIGDIGTLPRTINTLTLVDGVQSMEHNRVVLKRLDDAAIDNNNNNDNINNQRFLALNLFNCGAIIKLTDLPNMLQQRYLIKSSPIVHHPLFYKY